MLPVKGELHQLLEETRAAGKDTTNLERALKNRRFKAGKAVHSKSTKKTIGKYVYFSTGPDVRESDFE